MDAGPWMFLPLTMDETAQLASRTPLFLILLMEGCSGSTFVTHTAKRLLPGPHMVHYPWHYNTVHLPSPRCTAESMHHVWHRLLRCAAIQPVDQDGELLKAHYSRWYQRNGT